MQATPSAACVYRGGGDKIDAVKVNPFPWLPFWPRLGGRISWPGVAIGLLAGAAFIFLCIYFG